ncbi:restriction endonuclease subunit S [Vibrio coralliilyticus]|uniref:restriction endonuclease subunit S n=1 Tax=Vibrio coralliilyticus TaxID=190893 RepID=UPI000BAAA735|nr:restriction endonuclease subunit S [Vibrio coralliilyticus]NOI60416.1 restriction endonuclease subunit S [Vibrio coralliilyticus]PAT65813.1 restriction endonuclease subunit S [Vibrio coralliilyticus]
MSFDKLPDGWKLIPLEDAMDAIIDYRGKTPKKTESGIPLITAKIVKGGYILEPFEFIADDNYDSWMVRGLPQIGDVVLTTEAPLGETAQLTSANVALAQRIVTLRGKKGLLDNDYLLCALQSDFVQHQLESRSSGSTVKGIKQSELRKVSLPVPPLDEQQQIAQILKSLSNKLICNIQTNQTLEEMAQAIFKSWFVDFDPVKAKMKGEQPEGMDTATASLFPEKLVESELGLIPEGWKVGDLSDLMDFNPKRTLKKGTVAPYLDMKNMPTSGHLALDIYDREMGSGTKFMNGDSLLARITPCLENGKTAYVDFLEDEQVGWGSTEYIVMRSKSDSYKYFSYYMARFEPFRKFAIQSMTGTSGRQRAQAQTVQTMPFAIPPISILEKFDAFVAPNMQMIKSHGSENRTLANLRDTLLPKLLSGEIELN